MNCKYEFWCIIIMHSDQRSGEESSEFKVWVTNSTRSFYLPGDRFLDVCGLESQNTGRLTNFRVHGSREQIGWWQFSTNVFVVRADMWFGVKKYWQADECWGPHSHLLATITRVKRLYKKNSWFFLKIYSPIISLEATATTFEGRIMLWRQTYITFQGFWISNMRYGNTEARRIFLLFQVSWFQVTFQQKTQPKDTCARRDTWVPF